jgi:hypothetical protein
MNFGKKYVKNKVLAKLMNKMYETRDFPLG